MTAARLLIRLALTTLLGGLAGTGSFAGAAPAREASALPDPLAAPTGPTAVPDRVLLRLTPAAAALAREASTPAPGRLTRTGVAALDATVQRLGAVWLEREFPGEGAPAPGSALPDLTTFWIAHLPASVTRERALAAFAETRGIEAAGPIATVPVAAIPADSLWSRAWYFDQDSRRDVHAPEAWDITTGDTSVVIAIVDTGIIPYHPDLGGTVAGLAGQIWTNWAEAAGRPGVDDDGNGFVDDIHGWDFVGLTTSSEVMPGEDWRDPDNDPNDFAGHGTAVAGVAGALTNNTIGVSGTAWQTRIMPLRAGWASLPAPFGQVDLSYAARAIVYAARMGASVINCSFASIQQADLDAAVSTAIAAGITIVVAAGNNGSVHALSDHDDVISVAATDQDDKVALFSNRGSYVDLCAPGVNIATTLLTRTTDDSIGQRQCTYSLGATGTSFSAPMVAGAVALLQSDRRARGLAPLSPLLVQMRLRETSDDISSQNPTLTGFGDGRLNLYRALTDPPTSMALRARGRTVGPALMVTGASGHGRMAFAMSPGQLVMLDGTTGDTLWVRALSGPPIGGVSGADLGGGHGPGLFVASGNGIIEGFDLAGTPLPGWPEPATPGAYDGVPIEPVLGDLDGDGVLEVVWGGNDGYVWAWHADGSHVAGFPRRIGSPGRNVRLALSDFDGVPGVEIVAAAPSGTVHLISGNGTEWPGWPIGVVPGPVSPAIVRSPEADGPEILLASGAQIEAWAPDATRRWVVLLPGPVGEAPAAGDLDGDGVDEIVVPVLASTRLIVLSAEGGTIPGSWDVFGLPLGPPVIGPLRGGRTGVAVAVGGSVLQTRLSAVDATGDPIIGFPKPGRCGLDATLADVDDDGHTEIAIGAGADSVIYVYDAGAGSWNAKGGDWPTSRANSARTGSRLYAPTPPELDDAPPARVSDLGAEGVGATSLTLTWTAPNDPGPYGGAAAYDLRRAAVPLDDSDFGAGIPVAGVAPPSPAGRPDSARVTGLTEDTAYWFALRSRDASGNWSAVSTTIEVTTAGERPAAVRDLHVRTSSDTALTLVWTATGDDGTRGRPDHYLIRGGPVSDGPPSFDNAPIRLERPATTPAGGVESAVVGALVRGRRYWFALEAVDEAGNVSPLSNMIDALTGPLGAKVGVALAAGVQPARVPVDLFWQGAAGAAGSGQRIRIFDVTGRLRRTLILPAAGEGVVSWDGRDDSGQMAPAGLYFAQLMSAGWRAGARIALLR